MKKFLVLILSVIATFTAMISLAACDKKPSGNGGTTVTDGDKSGGEDDSQGGSQGGSESGEQGGSGETGGEDDPEHTHVFDQKVATSAHLKTEATCLHKAEYYKSCLCGANGEETFVDENGEYGAHKFSGTRTCVTCEQKITSEGLEFDESLDENNDDCYVVSGLGTCKDVDLLIPDTYNGLPVIGIDDGAFKGAADLKSITLPACITYIGDGAFDFGLLMKTSDLFTIYYEGTKKDWISIDYFDLFDYEDAEDYVDSDINHYDDEGTIAAVEGYVAAYKKVGGYRLFTEGVELTEVTIDDNFDIGEKEQAFCFDASIEKVVIAKNNYLLYPTAFSLCNNLNTVEITGENVDLGMMAFMLDFNLKNVIISGSLTSADASFAFCTALENVTLPESLTEISGQMFMGCVSLKSITIPDNVTKIYDEAFMGCTSLESVTIGKKVKGIDCDAFDSCNALKNLTVKEENVTFSSPDNKNLYSKDGKTLLRCLENTEYFSVLSGVEAIGINAFSYVNPIISLTLPASLTAVDDNTFLVFPRLAEIINNSELNIKSYASILSGSGGFNYDATATYVSAVTVHTGESKIVKEGDYKFVTGDDEVKYLIGYYGTEKEITLPSGEYAINNGAFMLNTSLTSVTIPNGVTELGYGVFIGCTSLKKLVIGKDVKANKYSQNNIIDIDSESLQTFIVSEDNPYYSSIDNKNLYSKDGETLLRCIVKDKSFVIPEGVKTIKSGAFPASAKFRSVIIPVSLINIEDEAFSWWYSKLNTIYYNGTIEQFQKINGLENLMIALDSVDGKIYINGELFSGHIHVFNQRSEDDKYVANRGNCQEPKSYYYTCSCGETGTETFDSYDLGDHVYNDNGICDICGHSYLKFTLNDKGDGYLVEGVEYEYRNTISTLVIPSEYNGLPVAGIGYAAFSNCTSITSIIIPDSITSIGGRSFYNCTSITRITFPDSVAYIGCGVFSECTALESITLPFVGESLDETGSPSYGYIGHVFDSGYVNRLPSSLKVVNINGGKIGEGAFSGCSQIESVTIGDGVTWISGRAFYNCTSLTDVSVSNSVTDIIEDAFEGCVSLKYNEYNNAKYLGNINNKFLWLMKVSVDDIVECEINNECRHIFSKVFSGCSSLTDVIISDSVVSIGNYAFGGCTSLTSIIIPKGVTSIGDGAFSDCTSLTSITIPEGVTSIGDDVFYNCTSLTSITIPDSVKSIGRGAFENCTSLTNLTIGNGVVSIGYETFAHCSSLITVTIPDCVVCISDYAFKDCELLNSIIIGKKVESVGDTAFVNCSLLTDIIVNTDNKKYKSIDGNLYTKDGKTLIRYAIGKTDNSFNIPDSVTRIEDFAFIGCVSLESVTIPNGVSSIGVCAFYDCGSLKYNEYDNGLYLGSSTNPYIALMKVKSSDISDCIINDNCRIIYPCAFDGCALLMRLTIPEKVIYIGDYAFRGCASLSKIVIPGDVTSIGNEVFAYCTSLTDVTIPEKVASIGSDAFKGCTALISITIPDSVEIIGSNAFSNCKSLTSIVIPDSVKSISDFAFDRCFSLTKITIPNSVTSIGNYAFNECSSLENIIYKGTVEQWRLIEKGYNWSCNTPSDFVINYQNEDF